MEYILKLTNNFRHKNYLIIPDINQEIIYIILKINSQHLDILNAYFDAYFYGLIISLQLKRHQNILNRAKFSTSGPLAKLYAHSQHERPLDSDDNRLAWQIMVSTDLLVSQEFKWWHEMLTQSGK